MVTVELGAENRICRFKYNPWEQSYKSQGRQVLLMLILFLENIPPFITWFPTESQKHLVFGHTKFVP